MRILHTSDWHLGRSLERINRIDEQREFVEYLCNLVEKENIDLVLIAGDIYDTYNPSAQAEELFYYAIDKLSGQGKRGVVVIAGNHDNPERLCASAPLACKNGIFLFGYPKTDISIYKDICRDIKIVDGGPGWVEISVNACPTNAIILTLPYPSETRLEEVLSNEVDERILQQAYSEKIGFILKELSSKFRKDTINIILGHIFLLGGKESDSERTLQVGNSLSVDASVLPANADFVLLGHLHRPQRIKDAPCPVFYSGSPLAYSFSEANYSKAVNLIEVLPGQEPDIRQIYMECGKPLVKWCADEGIEQAINWCKEGKDKNSWVDMEIFTNRVLTIEEQKQLRELHPGIINIRPQIKTKEEENIEIGKREGKKIEELFKEYFKYRTKSEVSEELMEAFLDILNDEKENEVEKE